MAAAKHILRYLKGNLGQGLLMGRDSNFISCSSL